MHVKKIFRNSVLLLLAFTVAIIIYTVTKTHPPENQVFYQLKRPPNIAHWGGMPLWPENIRYAFEQEFKLGVNEFMINRSQIVSPVIKRFDSGRMTTDNITAKIKKLDRFYFLIHGLCYAEMTYEKNETDLDKNLKRYLEHENKCARKWSSRLKDFTDNEALVIIPWHGHENGPISE